MPSVKHEAIVELFRNCPSLVPDLLRDVLHQPVPPYDTIEIHESSLNELTPTEYRADLVVLFKSTVPVFGTVIEVQLSCKKEKRLTWPYYGAALRAKLGCPTCVLVVAPDASVARWAAEPIDTGQPNSVFTPLVLGPDAVPVIVDADAARRAPELAILSVQAHGREDSAIDIAWAAVQAVTGLDEERARLYFDLVFSAVNQSARGALEALMQTSGYVYQSEFAKKYVKQGRDEGRVEGKAETLLQILDAREIEVSAEQRAAVEACRDLEQLTAWVARASRAESIEDVFGERTVK